MQSIRTFSPERLASDASSREKLISSVYEYLVASGAHRAAKSFLEEIHFDQPPSDMPYNSTAADSEPFLQQWWCVFYDLFSAAPERRDNFNHSSEAKAFHDYTQSQNPNSCTLVRPNGIADMTEFMMRGAPFHPAQHSPHSHHFSYANPHLAAMMAARGHPILNHPAMHSRMPTVPLPPHHPLEMMRARAMMIANLRTNNPSMLTGGRIPIPGPHPMNIPPQQLQQQLPSSPANIPANASMPVGRGSAEGEGSIASSPTAAGMNNIVQNGPPSNSSSSRSKKTRHTSDASSGRPPSHQGSMQSMGGLGSANPLGSPPQVSGSSMPTSSAAMMMMLMEQDQQQMMMANYLNQQQQHLLQQQQIHHQQQQLQQQRTQRSFFPLHINGGVNNTGAINNSQFCSNNVDYGGGGAVSVPGGRTGMVSPFAGAEPASASSSNYDGSSRSVGNIANHPINPYSGGPVAGGSGGGAGGVNATGSNSYGGYPPYPPSLGMNRVASVTPPQRMFPPGAAPPCVMLPMEESQSMQSVPAGAGGMLQSHGVSPAMPQHVNVGGLNLNGPHTMPVPTQQQQQQ